MLESFAGTCWFLIAQANAAPADSSWLYRVDLWIVAAYLLSMLLIGWFISEDSQSAEGYTLGNRDMNGWIVGLSVIGAYVSSITFLANPAKVYAANWNVLIFGLTLPLASLVCVPLLVPFYRKHVKLSAYEIFEQRFGIWSRIYVDVLFLALMVMRVASIQYLVAKALAPLLGFSMEFTIILAGVIVIIYDVMGGIKAVIWTDLIQVLLLLAGAIWCLFVLADRCGGWTTMMSQLPAEKTSFGPWWSWDRSVDTFFVTLLYGLLENFRNFGTDQNYVQRMLCTKSERDAKLALSMGAIGYIPIAIIFVLIGSGLYVHYQQHPELLVSATGQKLGKDDVFPHFMKTELSPAVCGLLIAAILSAAMSTTDANLNACSTIILADIIRPLRDRRNRMLGQQSVSNSTSVTPGFDVDLWWLRGSTIVFGTIGTVVSLYLVQSSGAYVLFDIWMKYAGAFGSGVAALFIVAWLMPRVPAWAAGLGMIAYLAIAIWGLSCMPAGNELSKPWKFPEWPMHGFMIGVTGAFALIVICVIAQLLVSVGIIAPNPRAAKVVPNHEQV